ncbi:MAG: ABC transporter permease [Lachnospiraceae bacterium]
MQTSKRFDMQKLLAPAALVILYIFFSLFGKNFFSTYTAKTILESTYYIGFMAFGVTFVIITGGIDLSIGTVMNCAALIGGTAYSMWGFPLWVALLLIPLVGLLFGVGNGFMVAKLKLPPFIATLGTMLVSQGFGSIISKVQTQRYSHHRLPGRLVQNPVFPDRNLPYRRGLSACRLPGGLVPAKSNPLRPL